MSFTGNAHLYAAVHEYGANDMMTALYNTRRHLFDRGSTPYVLPPSTSMVTSRAKIFGLIAWHVRFNNPRIDFDTVIPVQNGLPAGIDRFAIQTQFTFDWSITLGGWSFALPSVLLNIRAIGRRRTDTVTGIGLKIQHSQILTFPPPGFILAFIIDFVITTLLNWFIFSTLRFPLPSLAAGAFTPVVVGIPGIDSDLLHFQAIL